MAIERRTSQFGVQTLDSKGYRIQHSPIHALKTLDFQKTFDHFLSSEQKTSQEDAQPKSEIALVFGLRNRLSIYCLLSRSTVPALGLFREVWLAVWIKLLGILSKDSTEYKKHFKTGASNASVRTNILDRMKKCFRSASSIWRRSTTVDKSETHLSISILVSK